MANQLEIRGPPRVPPRKEAVGGPEPRSPARQRLRRALLQSQQVGLVAVLVAIGVALTFSAGTHVNPVTGETVNNFLNKYTLIQMATDASAFAIMGVGATIVIIVCAVDLSVGAIYGCDRCFTCR